MATSKICHFRMYEMCVPCSPLYSPSPVDFKVNLHCPYKHRNIDVWSVQPSKFNCIQMPTLKGQGSVNWSLKHVVGGFCCFFYVKSSAAKDQLESQHKSLACPVALVLMSVWTQCIYPFVQSC